MTASGRKNEDELGFAVVIPLYNKANEVGAALDSVFAQQLLPDEIIVVDDASTDGGAALVASRQDPRLRLLRRDAAGPGGYAARNLGIGAARAPWIAFLDADDVWAPDHLAELADLARRFPAAGCLATRYFHVFRSHREPDRVAGPLADGEPICLTFTQVLRAWLRTEHCPLWTGALAIRRTLLVQSGGFPVGRAERGGDKDLWLRVAHAAPTAFSPRATASFHREAADKLTDRIDTRSRPCLVPTARTLAMTASRLDRGLLRRLINQEIMLYARWAALAGVRPSTTLRDFSWPVQARPLLTWMAARYWPRHWLAAMSRSRRRSAKRSTSDRP